MRLEAKFHKAMLALYEHTNRAVYSPTLFFAAVANVGGRQAVKDLINKETAEGFYHLAEANRFDLTVEAYVIEHPEYWPLFTLDEIRRANARLRSFSYTPRVQA